MESAATVVLYPFPTMSHLTFMVEFAKHIHSQHPSLSLIIFIIPLPYESKSTNQYLNEVSSTVPFITFHHFPTVPIPPNFYTDFKDIAFGIPELYNQTFHNTLVSISQKSSIKAVFLELFTNAAFQVSKTLNLPTYYFCISGASGLCVLLYLITIHHTTSNNYKDVNTYLDIPGVPSIHTSDINKFLLDTKSKSYENLIKTVGNMVNSAGLIVSSFVGLEQRAVDALLDGKCIPPDGPKPPLYVIGPLITNASDASENECLKWLDSQPSKSVVFLCFGSMGHVFKKDQLKEIAIGLEKSGQRFLCVVREPDGEADSLLDDILPQGFLARTSGKGLMVKNWVPQPAILNHESVGGFVTHCGWNSVLESVVAGVPMVAWPLYAEQNMNKVFVVEGMKLGVAVKINKDGFVSAEEVSETVRELMEGEKGRVVRERVLEMSQEAKVAFQNGGSSQVDFFELTQSWIDL